jgi:hypothetical protein
LFRKSYVTLVCAVTLLLFTVAPVSAAPSLSLGSVASYSVAGKIQASQNCTAVPTNYTLQACYGIAPSSPPPPLPPPPTITVWIEDNGICQTNEPLCQFTPAVINAPEGSTIVWKNNGTLIHTVSSNVTGAVFDSGSIAPGGNFSYTFKFGGTYQYNDHTYGWMRGTIDIPIIFRIPEPPSSTQVVFIPSTPMQVELSGTVGWTVEGLSSSTANLLVSHNLAVSIPVPQLPVVSITPVTESGTLVQSIDLATRVESAGTATDLIEHVLDALAASSSSQGFNSGFGNIISQMSASATSDPSYTLWWVNGPLSNGSPVQVMDGWASVTGSETLNLGDLGSVQAWIVTSQFSQGVNLTVPSSPFAGPGPNARAAINLNFLWSYDKGSDLLARSFANGTITMHSASTTQVPTNGYCLNYPCAYTTVQVTRDMRLALTLALHLTSTSLSLDQRMRNGPTNDMASMLASMFATLWSALGFIGVVATAIIAFSLWLSRRVRKNAMPEATPAAAPGPPNAPIFSVLR